MKNTHDRYNVISLNIFMNDGIGRHDAYTNMLTESGTWGATFRKTLQATIKRVELSIVTRSYICASLSDKIAKNKSGVCVRRRSKNDPRHYSLSAARRAALRALCSSSVITSPRSISARASSIYGLAHSRSSAANSSSASFSTKSSCAASSIEGSPRAAACD